MAKELEYLPITTIPVGAQKEFLHEAYEATEECQLVKTEMARAYNPWRTAYQTMVSRYEQPAGNVDITKPIHQLDSQRDSVLFAIEVTTRAALKSIDPEMVAAAEAVEQTRISFPVNPNTGYLAQTSQLDFYLTAMLGAQLQNVTKIGALPLVQNLKAINDQVHELINSRDVERAGQENELYRSVARQQAIDAWQFLRKYVNGYSIVVVNPLQPNAQLDSFIDLMNVKARRYRDIYIGAPAKPGAGEAGVGDGEDSGSTGGSGEPTNPSEPSNPGTGGGSGSTGGSQTGSGSNGGSNGGGSGSTETPTDPTKILLLFNDGAHGNVIVKRMEVAPGYQLQASDLPEGFVYAFKADDQADLDAASPGDTVWVTLAPRG